MWTSKPLLGTPLDWGNPLNKDLALHLAMNEGHGDKVQDLSMNGNHGMMSGFAFPPTTASGWNPGQTGIVPILDGVDDYIDCGNNPSLGDGSGVFSAGCLLDYIAGDQQLFGNLIDNINGWGLEIRNSKISLGIKDTPEPGHWLGHGDDTLVGGNRYHLAFVYNHDGNYPDMYVNGRKQIVTEQLSYGVYMGLSGFATGGNAIRVGGGMGIFSSTVNYTTGIVDQPRIMNRAWSAKEIMNYAINPWQVYLDESD